MAGVNKSSSRLNEINEEGPLNLLKLEKEILLILMFIGREALILFYPTLSRLLALRTGVASNMV